jgi:cell division cycle protein 37
LTPALREFSQIKLDSKNTASTFQKSFEYIQAHPEIYVEGAVDALLVEAFGSQMKADKDRKMARYALQCVHQGLLLQYCEKLGKDGVRMFFKK